MKKLRIALIITFCILISFISKTAVSNSYDFTSNSITVNNDIKSTQEKLYPVLILKNNTNYDLMVTYDFYINETDASEFADDILVKANSSTILELEQLHHLGDTKESRNVWFSWSEKDKLKPSQNQIKTAIFSNPKSTPETELGLK